MAERDKARFSLTPQNLIEGAGLASHFDADALLATGRCWSIFILGNVSLSDFGSKLKRLQRRQY